MDREKWYAYLEQYNQEHLIQFWDQLNAEQREMLVNDLKCIDIPKALRTFQTTCNGGDQQSSIDDHLLEPLSDDIHHGVTKSTPEQLKSFRDSDIKVKESKLYCYDEEGKDKDQYEKNGTMTDNILPGLKAISEGRVAALLLAGGQGTRLGVSYPKGMLNVGLPSNKTLYQLQGERIRRLERLAFDATGKFSNIIWYIMTSEQTKEATEEFLAKHNHFGLKKDNIVIFEQNTLPCFTFDGKIILEQRHRIARAPDGNGGLYVALKQCGILDDMQKRGLKYVHVYCVDNILVKVADPTFIGYCISMGAEAGAKVVEKFAPTEAVGIICKVKGKYEVVEYSEVSMTIAEKRNSDGRLTFRAGNICNHFFTVDFLQNIWNKPLKHHIAKKKIPFVNHSGSIVKPEKPNGIKLEKFVFDVFHFTDKFVVWEVLREHEFSPLKNADGAEKDTPTTARQALSYLHEKYLVEAGGTFINDFNMKSKKSDVTVNGSIKNSCIDDVKCEISPLLSYEGEEIEHLVRGKSFHTPLYLYSDEEASNEIINGTQAINGVNGINGSNGYC
ncbi:UDP-N-acetylhexosamine pyrophosphorylase-like isoform X2 [Dinothrombium tinctorium]|uniref:UDP-N-acetylglucosamine diphosphorylase n=1 Tax=Dinothrombium tinctorium TaxID=1965070 RepID=A0A3S3RYD6_9ACAR|nr:UDP-N-acetylhexosamine pyrophosphorylase-like isoform X2 [Dinothrombium tinctorium]RWS07864.1 UDP-N-acetylhexosamine pyrophosphorylase-like isoform X2 [Dinothrombium tinctorium]